MATSQARVQNRRQPLRRSHSVASGKEKSQTRPHKVPNAPPPIQILLTVNPTKYTAQGPEYPRNKQHSSRYFSCVRCNNFYTALGVSVHSVHKNVLIWSFSKCWVDSFTSEFQDEADWASKLWKTNCFNEHVIASLGPIRGIGVNTHR